MTKVELHRLVDELPEPAVEPAGSLLRIAAEDPLLAMHLAAPADDEPLNTDDEAAIERGLRDASMGATRPLEAVLTELSSGA